MRTHCFFCSREQSVANGGCRAGVMDQLDFNAAASDAYLDDDDNTMVRRAVWRVCIVRSLWKRDFRETTVHLSGCSSETTGRGKFVRVSSQPTSFTRRLVGWSVGRSVGRSLGRSVARSKSLPLTASARLQMNLSSYRSCEQLFLPVPAARQAMNPTNMISAAHEAGKFIKDGLTTE